MFAVLLQPRPSLTSFENRTAVCLILRTKLTQLVREERKQKTRRTRRTFARNGLAVHCMKGSISPNTHPPFFPTSLSLSRSSIFYFSEFCFFYMSACIQTGENDRFPRSSAALFLARAVVVFAGCLSIFIARAPWNAAGIVTAVAYGGVLL
jgi:hypothetical protein